MGFSDSVYWGSGTELIPVCPSQAVRFVLLESGGLTKIMERVCCSPGRAV